MRTFRLPAIVAVVALAIAATTAPASAHSGGPHQLAVRSVEAHPGATTGTYEVIVLLSDKDSGGPASGFGASVEGKAGEGKTFGPLAMTPQDGGKYVASVPAEKGDWDLTIRAVGLPGQEEAAPLAESRSISFTDSASGAGDDGDGGTSVGAIVALIAFVTLIGAGGAVMLKRKPRLGAGV